MEELYYENPYQKDFNAEIIDVIEKDDTCYIVLDKTCFYPGDKDHPSDSGYIEGSEVKSVYKNEGKIYHVVDKKPLKIHRVKCTIDWHKRYDYMQQSLGQLIISGCIYDIFRANTLFTHLGNTSSYIDIDKILTLDELKKAETEANKFISNNIDIEILSLTNAELKKLSIKKTNLGFTGKSRAVKLGDMITVLSNAILPSSSIEVQCIKLVSFSKLAGGTRIEFICGSRSVSDYIAKSDILNEISRLLHCDMDNLMVKLKGLSGELDKANSERSSLKAEVAKYEVENMLRTSDSIAGIRVLKSIYDNADLKYVNLLASKLVSYPKVVTLFAVKAQDKAQLIFMCSNDLKIISMCSLLRDAVSLIDGKGGGTDFSAQGGGKNNNNLESSIEYAYRKLKDSLT